MWMSLQALGTVTVSATTAKKSPSFGTGSQIASGKSTGSRWTSPNTCTSDSAIEVIELSRRYRARSGACVTGSRVQMFQRSTPLSVPGSASNRRSPGIGDSPMGFSDALRVARLRREMDCACHTRMLVMSCTLPRSMLMLLPMTEVETVVSKRPSVTWAYEPVLGASDDVTGRNSARFAQSGCSGFHCGGGVSPAGRDATTVSQFSRDSGTMVRGLSPFSISRTTSQARMVLDGMTCPPRSTL